jgi:hypothetical protein
MGISLVVFCTKGSVWAKLNPRHLCSKDQPYLLNNSNSSPFLSLLFTILHHALHSDNLLSFLRSDSTVSSSFFLLLHEIVGVFEAQLSFCIPDTTRKVLNAE